MALYGGYILSSTRTWFEAVLRPIRSDSSPRHHCLSLLQLLVAEKADVNDEGIKSKQSIRQDLAGRLKYDSSLDGFTAEWWKTYVDQLSYNYRV